MFFALLFALNQLSCGALCSADALASYSGLLIRARYSRVEEAAFLTLDSTGRLHAIDWKSGQHDRASYVGLRPERCIGVMHTHPFGDNKPSFGDRNEAHRIRLPIVVVTPVAVTVAWPDGTVSSLIDGASWAAIQRPARR